MNFSTIEVSTIATEYELPLQMTTEISNQDAFPPKTNINNVVNNNNNNNQTYTFSPPHSIWGLDVETFSYIFLAIGGVAPVIFIAIVIMAMRCYTWHKLRKFHKYEERQRPGIELWDSEGKHYQPKNRKSQYAYDGPGQVLSDEELGTESNHSPHTNTEYQGLRASVNNPNVYFKEAKPHANHAPLTAIVSHQSHPTIPADVPNTTHEPRLQNGFQRRRISSEEQRALDCLDSVCDNLDISCSESESGSLRRGGNIASEGDKALVSGSGRSQRPASIIARDSISQSPGRSSLVERSLERSPARAALADRRHSTTGSSSPSVKLKIHKLTESESLEQRQSWLHTSFVNVAYDTEETDVT